MTAGATLDLSGIYPPIPTPFKENGDIDYDALRANLKHWNQFGLAGFVVQGSNGEVVYLSAEERVQVVKEVKACLPAGKLLIAGAGCEGTRETIRLCKAMAGAGADAALVINPHYYKGLMRNPEVIKNHYTKVADGSPIPVVLYNMPGNTGIELPTQTIIELARHPNIIGLKDSGGKVHKIAQVKSECPNFQVLAGSASFLLPALCVGATGGVCALANIAPQKCIELLDLYNKAELGKAKQLQGTLVEPNTAVTARFGVPGLKAAMEMLSMKGGPVREPLLNLTEANRSVVREILVKADILEDDCGHELIKSEVTPVEV